MHEDNASGTDSPKPTPRATNHVASGGQVGLQSEGDVTGATVVIAGTGVTAGSWHATQVGAQVRAAMDDLRQGMSRKPARASGSTRRTVHHDDGSVINIATGVVGIQARSEHGNTVHID